MKVVSNIRAPQSDYPQCSHEIEIRGRRTSQEWEKKWRKKRYGQDSDHKCCQRHAPYNVNGKPLCSTHAGKLALEFLTT